MLRPIKHAILLHYIVPDMPLAGHDVLAGHLQRAPHVVIQQLSFSLRPVAQYSASSDGNGYVQCKGITRVAPVRDIWGTVLKLSMSFLLISRDYSSNSGKEGQPTYMQDEFPHS